MVNEGDRDLGSHFLQLARLGSVGGGGGCDVGVDEEEEESPTKLNTINCSGGFLVVSTDKLSVQYTCVNLHGYDVGAVQANRPAPSRRLVYYFEMTVRNAGAKGQLSIGFTTEGFKMRRQPGWEVNSYGYHGDDGLLYHGQGKGEEFGPTFTTGDTVGGGINYASQEIFFTKNGMLVGTTNKDVKAPLFPTIAVHSQNEEASVNFGKDPFVFDVKGFEANVRTKLHAEIEKTSLPQNISYGIVRSYLLHYGYEETLKSFDLASKCTVPPINMAQENGFHGEDNVYALSQRRTLRQLIRDGKIDDAFSRLREWYPLIVQDDKSATCLLLHCQKFIELVRLGELEKAVKYGRLELAKYFGLKEFEELVQDCVALLAYPQPEKSLVGYLLEESQREVVADMVNAMVLSTDPNLKNSQDSLHSHLEKLLRQLTVCCLERRSLEGDQGEAFHLHRVLNSGKRLNAS